MPQRRLLSRFCRSAACFWAGRSAWLAWSLTVSLIVVVLLQLWTQYRLNLWNRDFFDALGRRDGAALWSQSLLFLPLMALSVALAAISVWGRMTTQRKWREILTSHLLSYWLDKGRYCRLDYMRAGTQNPEYRIAEDARIATDLPLDLGLGLLSSLLMAVTFVEVLWSVGGDFTVPLLGRPVTIPGYLVVSVILYSIVFTGAMMLIGRALKDVIQEKNQAEAELRAAANRLRESGEGAPSIDSAPAERVAVWATLHVALERWRELCWQLVGTTLVSQGNLLLAPVVAWALCAPKYLAGTMSLGELTQAAAAFVIVQGAFNWLIDNFQRLADWISSVNRVATLLYALDELDVADHAAAPAGGGRVKEALPLR
ncbi:MAG TPA: SbmA/BacA-like family transporter [Xanthobacteraceae bacterium]|nr:SbmA/BacA-like family transporter [Xanthobacteraceae bacterium]